MSKEELIKQLKELHGSRDVESAHYIADDLLIKFINDKDILDAYEAISKWYS